MVSVCSLSTLSIKKKKKKSCTFLNFSLKGIKCGQILAFRTKGEVIHSLSSALQAINLSGVSISFNH